MQFTNRSVSVCQLPIYKRRDLVIQRSNEVHSASSISYFPKER